MADKTHKLTLGKHSEDVTDEELAVIKKRLGARFAEYEVEPLKVTKPADVETPAKNKEKPTPAQ
jgi:hypothetical protein